MADHMDQLAHAHIDLYECRDVVFAGAISLAQVMPHRHARQRRSTTALRWTTSASHYSVVSPTMLDIAIAYRQYDQRFILLAGKFVSNDVSSHQNGRRQAATSVARRSARWPAA
jgi:hypothetical protein